MADEGGDPRLFRCRDGGAARTGPLWVRAVGFAAATLVYWRYVWKYKGVKEETAAALERERERQRREDDDT